MPSVLYSTYENKNLINQAVKQTFWMEIVFKVAPIKHVHLSVNYIGKCAPFAESFEICQIFLWHADVWWSETSNTEHGNMQQSNKKKNPVTKCLGLCPWSRQRFIFLFKIHPVELYDGFFSHSIALQMARAIAAL